MGDKEQIILLLREALKKKMIKNQVQNAKRLMKNDDFVSIIRSGHIGDDFTEIRSGDLSGSSNSTDSHQNSLNASNIM